MYIVAAGYEAGPGGNGIHGNFPQISLMPEGNGTIDLFKNCALSYSSTLDCTTTFLLLPAIFQPLLSS